MIPWISRNLINYFYIDYERNAFFYQGDELGMVNPRFNSIDEYQDLETQNKYISLKNKGGI
jgi:oligo-1,6-glucosidase